MSACPLCGNGLSQSTTALEMATQRIEEQENLITQIENRVLIGFIMGAVIGLIIAAFLWYVVGSTQRKEAARAFAQIETTAETN